jgi:hypothetical protein
MPCTYDYSQFSVKEKESIKSGKRTFCDYCAHSVFVDRTGNEKTDEFIFVECLITSITNNTPRCSLFEHYKQDDDDDG